MIHLWPKSVPEGASVITLDNPGPEVGNPELTKEQIEALCHKATVAYHGFKAWALKFGPGPEFAFKEIIEEEYDVAMLAAGPIGESIGGMEPGQEETVTRTAFMLFGAYLALKKIGKA